MLSSVKRKINKTPTQNASTIIRSVEAINSDVVTQILCSNYLGEGVFGFEIVTETPMTEEYVITPSFYRESLGEEVFRDFEYLKNDMTNLHCYNIVLNRPSFLPLFLGEPYSILDGIKKICSEYKQMYIQLLFTKRTDKWKFTFVKQYDAYIEGNDFPSEKLIKRKLQGSILKVMDKVSGFAPERETVAEIERKIRDHGYRFEFRIILHTQSDVEVIESEIQAVLSEMDFFNELALIKMRNKKEFLYNFLNRRYSRHSTEQILSESELLTIASDEHFVVEPKTIKQVGEEVKRVILNKPISASSHDILPLLPPAKIKENRELDSEVANAIPEALKTTKVVKDQNAEVIVKEVELGPRVQVVTFQMPTGILFTELTKRQKDIEFCLGKQQNSISIVPGKEPNTVCFLIPCEKTEVIYLVELLKDPEFIEFAKDNPLPFICGVDIYNKPIFRCLTKAPHLLICGSTNSGKSVFMNALLITFILLKKPHELRLVLIDPKQVELPQYNGFPHLVRDVVTNVKDAHETLDSLVKETHRRYAEFSKLGTGIKNIVDFNKKSSKKMPYVVIAVDEYADLILNVPAVDECIQSITQLSRAAGIHLILATQRPSADVINGTIKNNIPSKISFSLGNPSVDFKTVFGTGIPYKLLGYGDGVVKYFGQTEEFIRFQAPVVSLDNEEVEETIDKIKDYYNGDTSEPLELSTVSQEPEEEPLDKLRRIILETGETRSDPLQSAMGIRMTEVLKLRDQLVEEGTLRKEGRKFFITEDEEEEK